MKKIRLISVLTVFVMLLSMLSFSTFAANVSQLTTEQLDAIAERLNAAFTKNLASCDISEYSIEYSTENANALARLMYERCPELFNVSQTSIVFRSGEIIAIAADYRMSTDEYAPRLKKLRAAADAMVADLADFDDVTKALLLHDRLASACEYAENYETDDGEFENGIYTAYGALVSNKAVCEGYSLAYSYLLSRVGIDSRLCSSDRLVHTWNIVTIDGVEYHVDVTHDDPIPDIGGQVMHDYFLCSTQKLHELGRTAPDYDSTPNDTRYDDYFWSGSHSEVIAKDGVLYYIDSVNHTVMRDGATLFDITDRWNYDSEYIYNDSFVRLAIDRDGTVYINDKHSVYELDTYRGTLTSIWTPATEGNQIFGMSLQNGTLTVDIGLNVESPLTSRSMQVSEPSVDIPDDTDETDTSKIFTDVKNKKWYKAAVDYSYAHGFISGISKTEFGIDTPVTRAMFITILARIAGVDTSGDANRAAPKVFDDVPTGKYYSAAIAWAKKYSVVSGVSATEFAPNAAIERQQLCVMINNFARYMGIELTEKELGITFRDYVDIAKWAIDAVSACQRADIVNGYSVESGVAFRPTATATRAEAAQILYKFHKDYMVK